MPNNVDNRVVQMGFEYDKFKNGVDGSLKSIDDLKKGLNFSESTKGFAEIDRAAGGVKLGAISDGIDAIRNRFSLMGIVGITVIQNITNKLIGMAEQLARTFIIDPVSTGLSEYETQINAIQTILANTSSKGTTLGDVTTALSILNTYADKTIYNFTEMTRNIGTFTAAGIDLWTSVDAIKGIANLAAVSGSNSQQASTAMYQLSQALSSGTVKLMDWNSVVNAGMGGQVFQDALKDTARVHGIAIDQIIDQYGSFRESLSTGWITSEILTETLSKFTGDLNRGQLESMGYAEDQIDAILKMGQTANDAATKVKTLTQLNDTLMEAAQSGWTQSWELIIGNFDEAKKFFTGLSDKLGLVIGQSADARNAILTEWKDAGGRTLLIKSIMNLLDSALNLARFVGDAMKEIFPPITGKQLHDLTKGFYDFVVQIKMVSFRLEPLKRILMGLFAAIDILRMLFVALGTSVWELASGFSGAVPAVIEFLASIGDWIVNLRNAIKAGDVFNNFFETIFKYITPVIYSIVGAVGGLIDKIGEMNNIDTSGVKKFTDKLMEKFAPLKGLQTVLENIIGFFYKLIKVVAPFFTSLATIVGDTFNSFLDGLTNGLDRFDPSNLLQILNGGLFAGILLAAKNFIEEGTGIFGNFAEIFEGVTDTIEAFQNNINSKTLLNIAAALGIIAVSLLLISTIDSEKLAASLGAMTIMFVELFGALEALSRSSAGVSSLPVLTAGLIGVSTAMLILSAAIVNLGRLDAGSLARGTSTLTIMIITMRAAVETLSKSSKGAIGGAVGLTIFAGALLVMAQAVKVFGKIDIDILKQGLMAIGIVLLELAFFVSAVGGQKGILAVSAGLAILSGALYVLAGVVAIFGIMPLEMIGKGLGAIGIALMLVSATMKAMPKDMLLTGAGLMLVASALLIIAGAIRVMGDQSWEELAIGLGALTAVLTILAVALSAMNSSIVGAATLAIAAVGIGLLAISLKALGKMSMDEIGRALLILAAALTIIGVAGYLLTPVIPSLIGLGIALALIGVGALALGAGILALSIGLTALAAGGTAIVSALVVMLSAIISLIPMLAKQLGVALITLIKTVAEGAPLLLEAIVTLLLMIIEAIIQVIPPLVDAIFLLIDTLIDKIIENFPKIIQAGIDLLLEFLGAIRDNIGEVVKTSYDIVLEFVKAVREKLPEVIQAGWDLIIDFINGMANSIEENQPRLIEAAENLGAAITQGIIDGLNSLIEQLIFATVALANVILQRLRQVLGLHSPSKETHDIGTYIVLGLVTGIKATAGKAVNEVEKMGNDILSKLLETNAAISAGLAENMQFQPSVRPVVDLTDVAQGASVMRDILTGSPLNLDTAMNRSSLIANSLRSGFLDTEGNNGNQAKGPTIEYTQNNYSPKALSPIDIYRQTKNQLRRARGLVGNQ